MNRIEIAARKVVASAYITEAIKLATGDKHFAALVEGDAIEELKAALLAAAGEGEPKPSMPEITLCPRCEGSGIYNFQSCSLCNGGGRLDVNGEPLAIPHPSTPADLEEVAKDCELEAKAMRRAGIKSNEDAKNEALRAMGDANTKVCAERDGLRKELAAQTDKTANLIGQLAQAESKRIAMETELAAVKAERAEMEKDRASLKTRMNYYCGQVDTRQELYESCLREIHALQKGECWCYAGGSHGEPVSCWICRTKKEMKSLQEEVESLRAASQPQPPRMREEELQEKRDWLEKGMKALDGQPEYTVLQKLWVNVNAELAALDAAKKGGA